MRITPGSAGQRLQAGEFSGTGYVPKSIFGSSCYGAGHSTRLSEPRRLLCLCHRRAAPHLHVATARRNDAQSTLSRSQNARLGLPLSKYTLEQTHEFALLVSSRLGEDAHQIRARCADRYSLICSAIAKRKTGSYCRCQIRLFWG